jgi:hypothetical protein
MADVTFDADRIAQAHEAAAAHAEDVLKLSAAANLDAGLELDSEFSVLAQCVTAKIENGKVCINLPLHLGHKCLPVPKWVPAGEAQVCLSICYRLRIPTGVKVTVSVGGHVIITKVFGRC